MHDYSCTFEVLVNGKTIREYWHQDKMYIEGRHGKEYSLRFHNYSHLRKKIVVSVDGLNVMTGDSTWERGYVVNGYSEIIIPGWRQDSAKVAAFEFARLRDSYNQHNASGVASNVGVIGCKIFDEKPHTQVSYWPFYGHTVQHHHHYVKDYYPNNYWVKELRQNPPPMWNATFNSIGDAGGCATVNLASTIGDCGQNQMNVSGPASGVMDSAYHAMAIQNAAEPLGTGWGDDKTFHTVSVDFIAQDHAFHTFLIYYDSKDGLLRRGINLGQYTHNAPAPNAFPGDGCPKPR